MDRRRQHSQQEQRLHEASPRGWHRWLRRAVLLAVVSTMVQVQPVSAARMDFCNVNVSAGTWCGNNTQHTFYGQQVEVTPAMGRSCERMRNSASGVRGSGPHCGPYNTYYYAWCYSNPGQTTQLWLAEVGHDAGGSTLVQGHAFYGTSQPSFCNV